MSAYLEYTLDKFTFQVALDCYYNPEGVWAREEDGLIRIGISDYLQQHSGDVAFAEVVEKGQSVSVGEEIANIETIKIDISLPSPVSGSVVEANPELELGPEIINEDPYGGGWLVLIECKDWEADLEHLLDAQTYFEHMKIEAENEVEDK